MDSAVTAPAAPASDVSGPAFGHGSYPYDDISWADSLVVPGIGFDRARVDSLPGVGACRSYERFVVIEIPRTNELGSDVIVRPRTPAARCSADSVANDFVVRNEWAEYFMAMRGDWLFLDSGSGPLRAVIVYDVTARRRLTNFVGDLAGWRDSTSLLIWVAGDGEVPHAQCPRVPEGLTASPDSLFAHDLASNTRSFLGRWRCAGRS